MSIHQFLSKDNISTLWDVITDEDIFKFLSKNIQNKILQVFTENLGGFYNIEKTKSNHLMEINKKYILLILEHIRKLYPQKYPSKIKIHEEIMETTRKPLITYEEIQNDRKSQFEMDLQQRQDDFLHTMTIPVPPLPDFTDDKRDEPIKEMDKMLKEMMRQRNYELGNNNNNIYSSNNTNEINSNTNEINSNISKTNLKNVSWDNKEPTEIPYFSLDIEPEPTLEINLFQKLKRKTQDNTTNEINNTTNENLVIRMDLIEEHMRELNNKIEFVIKFLQTQNK